MRLYFHAQLKWGPKKRWSALSAKWNLGSTGKKKLWSSCDPSINCNIGQVGVPGPRGPASG